MSGAHNWRSEDGDAEIYFGHKQKQLDVADRRPVIRRASDLVGPGIAADAVLLTDFNDQLAQFNGYFVAPAGSANAPNSNEAFIGFVAMDEMVGGVQTFNGMDSETQYVRYMRRHPLDSSYVTWGPWKVRSGFRAGRTNVNASGSQTTSTIVFPTAFNGTPVVNVTSSNANWLLSRGTVTASNFEVVLTHRTGTGSATVTVDWQASLPTG